jgi:HprK-related kinase A
MMALALTTSDTPQLECRVEILAFHLRVLGPQCVIDLVECLFPQRAEKTHGSQAAPSSTIVVHHALEPHQHWRVVVDGDVVWSPTGTAELATVLAWQINSLAINALNRRHLLIHAGAVALGQSGIVLAGRSGSGKSTLTAALVAEGFSYFSDEVAVIAPDCGSLLPFQKAIKLERGSVPILASRYPQLMTATELMAGDNQEPTYLHPPDASWPSQPATPRFVIFPRYEPDARTRITALSRSAAFERLLANSFSAEHQGADGVGQIVQLLQACACFELTMSNIDHAVREVTRVVG